MPYAVTHVIITIILLDIIRHLVIKKTGNKKAFPMHYVFIGAVASLLPDFDVIFEFFSNFFGSSLNIHRLFSHSLVFPAIFLIAGLATIHLNQRNKYSFKKEKFNWSLLFFVIAASLFVHISLDYLIQGYIYPFWPFSANFYGVNMYPSSFYSNRLVPALDAIILLLWLWHEEHSRKITDFF